MEDFNSKYTGQQVEDLLDQVASDITEVYIADFTMGSLREGMNNSSQVNCDMQALVAAMNANKIILVRDDADSSVKGVYVLNGYAEDLLYFSIVDNAGNVLYCDGTDYVYTNSYIDGQTLFYRSWDYKQDELVSGENIKTINGESILGEGNIEISGGSGEVGPQGPQGDKGDKGDTGVGVQSVAQTTISNTDGGSNVVTVTLTNGTTSTFTVKNGSKGSQGEQGVQGEQGPKGDKGDKGDTGANGTNGVSVSSVKQTTTSTADGGTNVVTVTLSNGTTSTFNVKNGSKGSSGTNGTNGKDGADGEDGATFTPSVDSAGNLSWTNNKGLTNPPTVNIKGPKGDKGDDGEGGGGSGEGGKEVVLIQGMYFDSINPVQPNKIYISNIAQTAMYIGAFQEVSNYDEYCIIFKYPEDGVTLPESVKFANGQIPTIEYNTECELSVVGINSGTNRTYHAVITPFKTL